MCVVAWIRPVSAHGLSAIHVAETCQSSISWRLADDTHLVSWGTLEHLLTIATTRNLKNYVFEAQVMDEDLTS